MALPCNYSVARVDMGDGEGGMEEGSCTGREAMLTAISFGGEGGQRVQSDGTYPGDGWITWTTTKMSAISIVMSVLSSYW